MSYKLSDEAIKAIEDAVSADVDKRILGMPRLSAGPLKMHINIGTLSIDLVDILNVHITENKEWQKNHNGFGRGELRSIRKHLKTMLKTLDQELNA